MDMAIAVESPMGKVLHSVLNCSTSYTSTFLKKLATTVAESATSRYVTYREINPTLQRHIMYNDPNVQEWARISFSRLRLSSHRLRVETGR